MAKPGFGMATAKRHPGHAWPCTMASGQSEKPFNTSISQYGKNTQLTELREVVLELILDLAVKTHDLVAYQEQTGCLLKNTQKHSGNLCALYARIAQAHTGENSHSLLKRSIQ